MKKLKLVILISIFSFNINVFATSSNLSVSTGSVHVGESFTVTTNINSAAAWNIHVSSSGPVSGCSINQADATIDALDTNKSFSTTCTATGEGVITINLSGDITSASDGIAVNVSGSKSVNVTKKPISVNNKNNGENNSNTNTNVNNKSKNNKIKELSVEGYELIKVDNNNYTLTVDSAVTSIKVLATTEDSKAKVTGIGTHKLNIGENNIEIVATSESGIQNKINIKVVRKDGYYLDDLESVLNNNKIDDINIIIDSDDKISSQNIEKIKESKKLVKLNYYNNDKILIYSWLIDGSKIKNPHEFLTTVLFESENKKDISKLSNYADGLYISLKQPTNIPTGTDLKLYVANKFDNSDLINVYSYVKNNENLDLVKSKTSVEKGYIEFNPVIASDYLITMSTIPNVGEIIEPSKPSPAKIKPILVLVIIVLIIAIVLTTLIKKKKTNKDFIKN